MADPFVAEVRIFGFNFAPKGWATCDGQILPLSQNTALFSLLGTTYGGDGKSNFALPNLAGMTCVDRGQGQGLSERFQGEESGEDFVTLLDERTLGRLVPRDFRELGLPDAAVQLDQEFPIGVGDGP